MLLDLRGTELFQQHRHQPRIWTVEVLVGGTRGEPQQQLAEQAGDGDRTAFTRQARSGARLDEQAVALERRTPADAMTHVGNCGECRVKLIRGEVELDEPNSLTPEERAQGHMLTCVACPLPPTTIEIEAEQELE